MKNDGRINEYKATSVVLSGDRLVKPVIVEET